MEINLLLSKVQGTEFQIIHVQKKDQKFTLIPFEDLNTPGSQIATVVALSNIIETGMFALYNRNLNRIYFNSKVFQEAEGITPSASKIANLRAAILPTNDVNDEVNNAEFDEMDDEKYAALGKAIAKIQNDAAKISSERNIKSESEKSEPSTKLVSIQKSPKFQRSNANPISSTSKTANKQKRTNSPAKEDRIKDEKAYQAQRNQLYTQKIEVEKEEMIKQKREVFELKKETQYFIVN